LDRRVSKQTVNHAEDIELFLETLVLNGVRGTPIYGRDQVFTQKDEQLGQLLSRISLVYVKE
jgi:hypothetical protein